MKIVLVGKNGQLGSDCLQVLNKTHDLVALGSRDLDITDPNRVEAMVRHHFPEVIVNCAAYTKVDACEHERELTYQINVNGPRYLAASLARHGGTLLHISTDYVFDGKNPIPKPYLEDDTVSPLSFYGRTKVEAEQVVMQELDQYIIVRTAWMYGRHGHNFLKTMLRLALSKPPPSLKVVNDQFGSLTWSYRLAEQLAKIIATGGRGIYHATSEGYSSWFDVANYFLQGMGITANLTPCTTAEYPTPACRPQNSILENHRLKAQGINVMRPWHSDLDEFISKYRGFLIQEVEDNLSKG